MFKLKRLLLIITKNLRFFSLLSIWVVYLTGKSKFRIHPKHLVNEVLWFEKYLNKLDVVLDLGCSHGEISRKVASKVKTVLAVDKNVISNNRVGNLIFKRFDIEEPLPFRSESFSKVLFLDVLEHLNKRDQAIAEARRVLKKGGLLFLSVPNSETGWKRLQRQYNINSFTDPDHKVEYSKEKILQICKANNFRVISLEPIVYDTPWAPIIDFCGAFSLSLYKRLLGWKRNRLLVNSDETIGYRVVVGRL